MNKDYQYLKNINFPYDIKKFSTTDLKKNKSSAAVNKLRKINPDIKLHSFNKKLTKKSTRFLITVVGL